MEVSTCQCQRVGTLPVSWHCQKTHLERAPLGRKQARTTTRNDVRCRACSFSAGGWTFHSELRRCALRTCHDPIGLFQGFEDLLTFCLFERVAKPAICRSLSRTLFCWR